MTDQLAKRASRATHVARSTLLIAAFFALDKLLGLFRQVVVGRQFGVGAELDVFNAANNLPDLLFALISGGALAVAFIPVLSATMERDGRSALWALFSRVANIAFVITGALALLLALFADPLVRAEFGIAPGFTPERQALVADLMRLDLVATLIFSLSGLVSAGLQANQHFLLPAAAPVVYDVGQIFGALVLAPAEPYQIAGFSIPAFGLGVHGLVYGVILGAALHLAVQIPGLVRYRFRWAPRLDIHSPGVRRVARLMGPRILTIGAFQLIFVVQDNLASRLDVGSITGLAYGWLIMQVPETIIGTAIGIALLPTLAEHFARGDNDGFAASIRRAVRVMVGLTLPAASLMAATLPALVQAAFGFTVEGTAVVVWAARAYLVGLVGHSLIEVAARAFYARQDARTPLLTTAANAVTFAILSLLLFRPLASAGIALSNSLAFSLEALLLVVLLARSFPTILEDGRAFARIAAGALAGGGAAWAAANWLPTGGLLASIFGLAIGGAITLPFVLPELRALRKL
ncbi:MAG: murein biosynthesis integral membrane protein MurJ [Anaerolineales bacterium]